MAVSTRDDGCGQVAIRLAHKGFGATPIGFSAWHGGRFERQR